MTLFVRAVLGFLREPLPVTPVALGPPWATTCGEADWCAGTWLPGATPDAGTPGVPETPPILSNTRT
mgnify:CR=1 FL=1